MDNPALLYPGAGFGQTPLSFSEVRARMSCLQVDFITSIFIQNKYL